MKGYKFFLEYKNKTQKNKGTRKKPGNHLGNVLALFCDVYGRSFYYSTYRDQRTKEPIYEGIGAIFFHPNSQVGSASPCHDYIISQCKRISEALAREIHPALFEYIDMVEE